MNRKIATTVVTVLVLAMVGTIIWNEYSAGMPGRQGAGELGSVGEPKQDVSTPGLFLPSNMSPTISNTPTLALPSSLTPPPPVTSTPTETPSPTAITPTLLQVAAQFGANLRDAPAGEVIQGLPEDTLVQAYPEKEAEAGGLHWLHVVTMDGVEGWLAVNNLIPFSGTLTAIP